MAQTLKQRVMELEQIIAQLGVTLPASESEDPKERPDYIEYGSPAHAEHLGLRKATEADEMVFDGWALADMTMFGPRVRPEFLREVLRGKVSTLNSGGPPIPQSKDRQAANYAPPMWTPETAHL